MYTLNDSLKLEFETFKSTIHREMEALSITISNSKPKMEVAPVMKWGQSDNEVHIFLKLSHRFDSPGCLDLSKEPEVFLENNSLRFRAECVQASYPLIFVLDFQVFKEVEKIQLEKMSIGNYRLILFKKNIDIWEDLFANFEDRNKFVIKIWYELEDRYPDAMARFYAKMEKYFKLKKEEKKRRATRATLESCPGHLKHFAAIIRDSLKVQKCPVKK